MFCRSLFNHHKESLRRQTGNYLEIGVYNGDAIAELAQMYPHKKIIGVDPFIEDGYTSWTSGVDQGKPLETQKQATYRNIRGKSNVEFHEMTSRQFLEQLTPEYIEQANVTSVMIDGDHHYENVRVDVELAIRLIGSKAGEVTFDDISCPDVAQAIREFEQLVEGRISKKVDTGHNSLIYTLTALV